MSAADSDKHHYLYGPVPSRRLGRSLGVDIVPYKVCSYDCIYCQLGRTTKLTSTPERFVSAEDVVRDIEQWLEQNGTADYITFAGSGEPTLNSELGEMIRATKGLTDIPLAVITNGSLLNDPKIREAVLMADVILPSLDAGTEYTFRIINRPAPGVRFEQVIEGLMRTSVEFSGPIWLEVMLVEGVNDSDDEIYAIREIVRHIWPDKLQINTVERPSRSGNASRVSKERLIEVCEIMGEDAEIIASNTAESVADGQQWQQMESELIRMLSVRPCTVGDIVAASGFNILEVTKCLQKLEQKGIVERVGDIDHYYRYVKGVQQDDR